MFALQGIKAIGSSGKNGAAFLSGLKNNLNRKKDSSPQRFWICA